jgi:sugar phosphate isomerase/epimerase
MRHYLSTHLFVNHRCTTALLDRIARTGVTGVELFCARQHLDYRNGNQVEEIAAWFQDSDMKLHSLHAPIFTDDVWGRSGPQSVIRINEPVKAKRVGMVDEIKRALGILETIPCDFVVMHLGAPDDAEFDERKVEAAFTSLEELRLFARQRGSNILLENIPNAYSSAQRLMQFLNTTHLDLGFCFDTGHAHLNEGIAQAFEIMGPRIRSTHIHDNDAENDRHLFPFLSEGGTIDWAKTMALFRPYEQQFPLLLELKESEAIKTSLESAITVFDRLENA